MFCDKDLEAALLAFCAAAAVGDVWGFEERKVGLGVYRYTLHLHVSCIPFGKHAFDIRDDVVHALDVVGNLHGD